MALALGVLGCVCLVEVNSRKFGPVPFCGDGVILLKGLFQMVSMVFTNVFNTKVSDDEEKRIWWYLWRQSLVVVATS